MSLSGSADRTRGWASGCVVVGACLMVLWPSGAAAGDDRMPEAANLRVRVATDDGELVVLDAAAAGPDVRGDAGWVAFWWDHATAEVYVYDRTVVSRRDLTLALSRLRRELGVEPTPPEFVDSVRRNGWVKQTVAEQSHAEPASWVAATPQIVAEMLGLSPPSGQPSIVQDPCLCTRLDDGDGVVAALPVFDPLDEIIFRTGVIGWCACPPPSDGGTPPSPSPSPGSGGCTCCFCRPSQGSHYGPTCCDTCDGPPAPCDDHDPCTINDVCMIWLNPDGTGTPGCFGEWKCDDGDSCSFDRCDREAGGVCENEPACDGDKCCPNGASHYCCTSPNAICCFDPPHCCPSGETCCGSGCCGPGETCIDGVCCGECDTTVCEGGSCCRGFCTGTQCCPGIDCNGQCCGDLDSCTAYPTCDAGQCVTGSPCPASEDPCMVASCEQSNFPCPSADCVLDPAPPGTACDDEDPPNPCTLNICDLAGFCQHPPTNEGGACNENDNNPCTVGQCIGGTCVPVPGNEGNLCDDNDGNPCTRGECQSGNCMPVCEPLCTGPCTASGGQSGWCDNCACIPEACAMTLTSATAAPCETVDLFLGVDCSPPCGSSMTFTSSANYPPGHEDVEPWLTLIPPGPKSCNSGAELLPLRVVVHDDAPAGPVEIGVTAMTTLGAQCSTTATLTVTPLTIVGERVDQDDPLNSAWEALAETWPVYGGSEASTADNLRLTVIAGSGVTNVIWTVAGDGSAAWPAPPTGPAAVQWDIGDVLNPVPGEVTFRAEVIYTGGTHRCGAFKTEIGVRTDDVIVIGWIDPNNVPLNPAGVNATLLVQFPVTGPPTGLGAVSILADLAHGNTSPGGIPMSVTVPGGNANREYMLHWLFKYTGNPDPRTVTGPLDFRDDTNTFLEVSKLGAFASVSTNYKLLQRFQVKYRADATGFVGTPTITQSFWALGWTQDPTWTVGLLPGQIGPNNGTVGQTLESIWQVNEGSPDANGVLVSNTLMGNAVPADQKFWESIGSRIRFRYDNGTEPVISTQVYPTYYEYRNGRRVTIYPQAASPDENFLLFPYPFGAVPCDGSTSYGSIPFPHAQGRCGNATATEETSARIPPFLP